MTNQVKRIDAAVVIIDKILPILSEAKRQMKSARNWGFVDLFGGGLLTDIIKHSKINSAASSMNEVSDLLNDLKRELGNVSLPSDYRMHIGGFSTFADFLFDGVIADAYMQGKILDSLDSVKDLERKLEDLRGKLIEMMKATSNYGQTAKKMLP